MQVVYCIPVCQYNAVKVISQLKEMSAEYGLLENLCTSNGLQYIISISADSTC